MRLLSNAVPHNVDHVGGGKKKKKNTTTPWQDSESADFFDAVLDGSTPLQVLYNLQVIGACLQVLYNLQVRLEREARVRGGLAGCGCKRGG